MKTHKEFLGVMAILLLFSTSSAQVSISGSASGLCPGSTYRYTASGCSNLSTLGWSILGGDITSTETIGSEGYANREVEQYCNR